MIMLANILKMNVLLTSKYIQENCLIKIIQSPTEYVLNAFLSFNRLRIIFRVSLTVVYSTEYMKGIKFRKIPHLKASFRYSLSLVHCSAMAKRAYVPIKSIVYYYYYYTKIDIE